MQLNHIFEDLEAQFDAQLSSSNLNAPFEDCTMLRLRTSTGRTAELVMPFIGEDFVAGMEIGINQLKIFRYLGVAEFEIVNLRQPGLPKVRQLTQETAEFIANFEFPIEVSWLTIGSKSLEVGLLVSISEELLIIERPSKRTTLAVPIAAVIELNISSVHNFSAAR